MTSQRPGPGEGSGRDPVEAFFAAHRAQVRDEPADDLAWQRIRDGRRRNSSARRGAWAGALVAAAASVGVVFGPGLLPDAAESDLAGPQPSVTDPVTADPTLPADTQPTDQPIGTDDPEQPQTVTAPVPAPQILQGSRFTDVSTADPERGPDTGVRFALVTQECSEGVSCATLARSEDRGTTWTPTADLRDLGPVDRITFTDQSRGWAWGTGPLWGTTDGGRTWTAVDGVLGTVQDVSVRGEELLATTRTHDPEPCRSSTCPVLSGAVVVADPADANWSDNDWVELGPLSSLALLAAGDQHYVVASGENAVVSGLWRLEAGTPESTASLLACGTGPVAVTVSHEEPQRLWALCDDPLGLSLHESSNGARTWAPTTVTVPSFVLGERPPLMASTGAEHLLLVGQGNFAVTIDGGQTWSTEEFLPGAAAPPDRLEVTVFGEILAYPAAGQGPADLAFWRSGDGGVTWEAVQRAD